MTFNKVLIEVLDKEFPRVKRKSWEEKKLQFNFPKGLKGVILNDKDVIIDDFYILTEEDSKASDWEVVE